MQCNAIIVAEQHLSLYSALIYQSSLGVTYRRIASLRLATLFLSLLVIILDCRIIAVNADGHLSTPTRPHFISRREY